MNLIEVLCFDVDLDIIDYNEFEWSNAEVGDEVFTSQLDQLEAEALPEHFPHTTQGLQQYVQSKRNPTTVCKTEGVVEMFQCV